MHDEDEREMRMVEEMIARMFRQMTGPLSDMTRALMSAQVDGLIDARRKFAAEGWEDRMISEAMGLLLKSAQGIPEQVGKGLTKGKG